MVALSLHRIGVAATVFVLGCCPRPLTNTAPPAAAGPKDKVAVLDPSPLLELVRSEREALEGDPAARREAVSGLEEAAPWGSATHAANGAPSEPEDPAIDQDDSSDDEEWSEEGEVREVVVRTSPLATIEDLLRADLRYAEARRPRELHESRLLLRQAGPVRTCCGDEAAERRRLGRDAIRLHRDALKRCVVAARARRPDIMAVAPASLVVEQAMRRGDPMVYRFTLTHDGSDVEVVDQSGNLDAEGRACIEAVVSSDMTALGPVAVSIPVVVFAQKRFGYGGGGRHELLAQQAAILGWLHYDRGEYADAVRYFRDAYWVFHLVEYRLLEGMAWEAMGERQRAVVAFAAYLDRRPKGLDAEPTRKRLQALRQSPQ